MSDPVSRQIGRTRVQGRAANPFASLLDRFMARSEDIRRARLGLEVHQAKNNLNREHQKNIAADALEEMKAAKGIGVERFDRSYMGSVSARFRAEDQTQENAPAASAPSEEPAPNPVKDAYDKPKPINIMADHERETNTPAPAEKTPVKSRPGSYRDTKAAVNSGHITEEEAVHISPIYAQHYATRKAATDLEAQKPRIKKG